MSKSTDSASGGIGFTGLLALIFITLKLIGKIDWPWLWVLSPIWIPIALFLATVSLRQAMTIVELLKSREDVCITGPGFARIFIGAKGGFEVWAGSRRPKMVANGLDEEAAVARFLEEIER